MIQLLIDADILAYKAAATSQTTVQWSGCEPTVSTDMEAAKKHAEEVLNKLMDTFETNDVLICLSDDFDNYRNDIWPQYKQTRKGSERPALLYDMKDWLAEEYCHMRIPRLEADDVMGILATDPHGADCLIISEDKDMRTVPGLVYHPHRPEQGIMEITPLEANRFLLYQTICGDATDGYPGVKGVGPSSPWVEGLWDTDDPLEMWDMVLAAYHSKGLTEKDAITQARMARILVHGLYHPHKNKPLLWDPSCLLW